MDQYDVIVLGGGPNGLLTALSLGGSTLPCPLKVLVLDIRDPRLLTTDTRGTALTQATQTMFKTLGLWNRLKPLATDMCDILVTDAAGGHAERPPLLSFETAEHAQAAAAIVENCHLNAALVEAAEQSPHITLQGGFDFAKLETTAGFVAVHAISGQMVKAHLLVAADGRQSKVREASHIPVKTHDYGQTALSFSIGHTSEHHQTAEEHFSALGVFAVLPLTGRRSSIVWGTSTDHARHLMSLDDAAFDAALNDQMGHRLGKVSVEGRKAAYPIIAQIADAFIAPRVALVGDAAHAIHPLAGLGLNLGFKDAAALADHVAAAFGTGSDIGGLQVLDAYQVARRFDTVVTSLAMDTMNGLFVNNNPVLQAVRKIGLRGVDHMPSAKEFFMGQAAGLSSDNPRLMQGLFPG
jgi:2-octaprenyl-6-methoxyphenol hydroxylase